MKNKKSAILYVGRYTGRPAIADSRIIKYDGEKVAIYYERHEDGKRIEEEMDALEFIRKVIIHIPEKQFKMIRYYGIYASHTEERPYLIKMVNEKILELKKQLDSWKYRIMKSFGHDPLTCPKCKGEMVMTDVYHPKYGSIYEKLYQKEYTRINKQIEEVKETYRTIKNLSEGKLEPVYK